MQLRQRALVVLAAVCIGGAAVYGRISLLRDLTGILTSIALVVLAGVIAYLLVQALVAAARRARRRRRAGAKVDGQDVVVVKRELMVRDRGLPLRQHSSLSLHTSVPHPTYSRAFLSITVVGCQTTWLAPSTVPWRRRCPPGRSGIR